MPSFLLYTLRGVIFFQETVIGYCYKIFTSHLQIFCLRIYIHTLVSCVRQLNFSSSRSDSDNEVVNTHVNELSNHIYNDNHSYDSYVS